MTKKIYANKIVKATLNAYMRAVYTHDTQEVHIGKELSANISASYAEWQNGKIIVRLNIMKGVKIVDRMAVDLSTFNTDEQNKIVRSLLDSMAQDMAWFANDGYLTQRGE